MSSILIYSKILFLQHGYCFIVNHEAFLHGLFTGLSKDQKDYYVKWESLPYSEATWEVVSLIERKWPQKIKEFQEREESKKTPSKMTRALRSRPKFVKINEQPEYMGGNEVRKYFCLS